MGRLGFKSKVYDGELYLGELEAIPVENSSSNSNDDSINFRFPNNEIRITHLSPTSERCPPLSVIQTISPFTVRCKLESALPPDQQPHLLALHSSCFYELKTAVMILGDEEMHLVAMPSKQKKFPCFWCYLVPLGIYISCLAMLNLRCLSIVFDLDETLIVANTLKSFEDRIELIKGWISHETDPVRLSGMSAELKRYVDDRALLKQYAEYDCIIDGGKVYKIQSEEVPQLSDNHEKIVRPVIRLPERNLVLTRINPEIRDTSVLVRLRPAWEDLRSYLTAKGRKRFEVYVCTMAERDYALEMWRLLDPEAHLIGSKDLLGRVVCVKSGLRKSLLNVFQDGTCQPNMAMVIDDRSKVWEEKDQPRVHVVPPFTPYYAPQAEMANAVPVLCVARNVACNVRGGFFREFDENLLRKISEIYYEDEVLKLPSPPDVSNYLLSEDMGAVPNGNLNFAATEGIYGSEVEQKLSKCEATKSLASAGDDVVNGRDVRPANSQLHASNNIMSVAYSRTLSLSQKPSLLGIPARKDDLSSVASIDAKKKPLMANQGVASRETLLQLHAETPPLLPQSRGGWLIEEDNNMGHLINQYMAGPRHDLQKQNNSLSQPASGGTRDITLSQKQVTSNRKELQVNALKVNVAQSALSIAVLQEIGRRCSCKVEFRPVLSASKDLQFTVEVLFTGEKIGIGTGKTRKDAQQQAAENALHSLADNYLAYVALTDGFHQDVGKLSTGNENGFVWDDINSEPEELLNNEKLSKVINSEGGELVPRAASSAAANPCDNLSSSGVNMATDDKLAPSRCGGSRSQNATTVSLQ